MSDEPEERGGACRGWELLMMKKLDGEITAQEDARLGEHLAACEKCAGRFEEYSKLVAATAEVEMRDVSDEQWDRYWNGVYNRLERGTAWVLVSLGAVVAFTYAGFRAIIALIQDPDMAFWAKAGVLALAAGLALLFVSVLRERLTLRRFDRYREIKR
ncbi:MAG: anti-sigma factor family protein [Planctomycetota bacterium]|jgi:anti-sigma factor RsiW